MVHFAQTPSGTAVAARKTATGPHATTSVALEASPAARDAAAATRDLEQLGDDIATLAAHVHAATYQLLVLLAEFDARDGWSSPGFRSCAHWLSWRTGIAPGAAREKVRTARALRALPSIGAAMRKGELSFAKVRALTRVATPQNEAELLDVARSATAAQVETIVRAWRRADRLEEEDADRARHDARQLSMYIDDDGMYVLRARLEPEAGALLERAIEVAGDALWNSARVDSPPGVRRTHELLRSDEMLRSDELQRSDDVSQRRADALALVAELALARTSEAGRRHPSFEVIVHVEAAALRTASGAGHAVVAGGARVSAETSRRIACDADRVTMIRDVAGNTLDVGRRTRTVPPAIRRALAHRDRTCRFPGCEMRYCDAHHIVHWADGGPTSLDNLVLLCRHHHRAVHEGGLRVDRDPGGGVQFREPAGRVIPAVPSTPVIRGDISGLNAAAGTEVDGSSLAGFYAPLDVHMAVLTLRACTSDVAPAGEVRA